MTGSQTRKAFGSTDPALQCYRALQNRLELAHGNKTCKKRAENDSRICTAMLDQPAAISEALNKGKQTQG